MTTATTMTQCPYCHEYSFRIHCLCHRYRCWLSENEAGDLEKATTMYAKNPLVAIGKITEAHWVESQMDPTSNPGLEVWISDNGFIQKYIVTAEMEVSYTAEKQINNLPEPTAASTAT